MPLFVGPGHIKQPVQRIWAGLYDFNQLIRSDSKVRVLLPDDSSLKKGVNYHVRKDKNAFEITRHGKARIDKAGFKKCLIRYSANDASSVSFEAWTTDKLGPPRGWRSKDLTSIANKVIGKTDDGQLYENVLRVKKYTNWRWSDIGGIL